MKQSEPQIRREPIVLSDHAIAVIHIFDRHDHLEDIWMSDWDSYMIEREKQAEKSAIQFVTQLEEHWTPCFLRALRDELTKELEKHDEECGTNIAHGPID